MEWNLEKKQIIKDYMNQFEKHGINNKSLFFPGQKQNVRFNVIKEIGITNNDSILDVGCGFGDLYKYLKEAINFEGKYTGIDITPDFIEVCKSLYPTLDFRVLDIIEENTIEQWDYVVLSGTLNINIGEKHWEFVKSMINTMFKLSKKGVSVDFVSIYGDNRHENIFRADPGEVFSFCKTLSKRVALRNDYLPWEFCVYLFKDDSLTEDNIFTQYQFEKIIQYL
ncbi:MAG: methyltransferase domain-containing protein [Bacteroidetes bacterium]|nr:methyltransferase domain-containing protein [Bacteroidota bacterium]